MNERKRPEDPIEGVVYDALVSAGIVFTMEGDADHPDHRLDFDLTDYGVAVECKFRHSDRSNDQLSRKRDTILVQGVNAAAFFADQISR